MKRFIYVFENVFRNYNQFSCQETRTVQCKLKFRGGSGGIGTSMQSKGFQGEWSQCKFLKLQPWKCNFSRIGQRIKDKW